MKRHIKSTSKVFNDQVEDLTKIFFGYKRYTKKMKMDLEKLGYRVEHDHNHFKCYYEGYLITVIANSPSDSNTGNQIIRNFRTFWERKENKNTI